MATQAKEINTAEAAYAAINFYDKVLYIQHLKVSIALLKYSLHVSFHCGLYLFGTILNLTW